MEDFTLMHGVPLYMRLPEMSVYPTLFLYSTQVAMDWMRHLDDQLPVCLFEPTRTPCIFTRTFSSYRTPFPEHCDTTSQLVP